MRVSEIIGFAPASPHWTGSVAQSLCCPRLPFAWTDSSRDLCDGGAKGGVAVPDGEADLTWAS